MRISIYHNLRTDRQCKASTGMRLSEFDRLLPIFSKHYVFEDLDKSDLDGRREISFKDKREALFFILFYLKNYPTLMIMGLLFGVSDCAAHNYIGRLKPCLDAALKELGMHPARALHTKQEFQQAFEGVKDALIDATEIPTTRPADREERKIRYSGKKKISR